MHTYTLIPAEVCARKGWGDLSPHDHAMSEIGYPIYATLEEARAASIAHAGTTVIRVPIVSPSLTAAAESCCMSVAAFGNALWQIGQYLQAHNGTSEDDLRANGCAIAALAAGDILSGMMFKSDGGRRGREYKSNAWYVNRRPSEGDVWAWQIQWLTLFGGVEELLSITEEIHTAREAYAESIRRKITRAHDRPYLEQHPTREIAHRAAVAQLQRDYYHQLFILTRDETYAYMGNVWSAERRVMQQELSYRTEAEPESRGSKKKDEDAKRDFRKAAEYIANGIGAFFTEAYIDAYLHMDTPALHMPDDDLPRDILSRMPAHRQSDRELLQSVIGLAGLELDAASFEYEDVQLLLSKIRGILQSIRSEHIR